MIQGLASKEAELVKDGSNTDKSYNCTKQSIVPTDSMKTVDQATREADAPSSVNGASCGPESQTKMDCDNVPSSSGTTKNYLFKIGGYFYMQTT